MEKALRQGDLAKASKLQYGDIPELEKRIAAADARSDNMSEATASTHLLSDSVSQ